MLIVISGPSCVGKGTIIKELRRLVPSLQLSISYTTRGPRPGEKDGVDYHFISMDDFVSKSMAGEFAEWKEVHGNLYGTLKKDLDELLLGDRDVIAEIDYKGMLELKVLYKRVLTIFIMPPSMEELRRRFLNPDRRESADKIERRLQTAKEEMTNAWRYHDRIQNCNLNEAVELVIRRIEISKGAVL